MNDLGVNFKAGKKVKRPYEADEADEADKKS
jgi:hypothetical protein